MPFVYFFCDIYAFSIDVEIIFYIEEISLLAYLRKSSKKFQFTLECVCCIGGKVFKNDVLTFVKDSIWLLSYTQEGFLH